MIALLLLHRHRAVVQDAINIATGQLKFVTVQATAAIIICLGISWNGTATSGGGVDATKIRWIEPLNTANSNAVNPERQRERERSEKAFDFCRDNNLLEDTLLWGVETPHSYGNAHLRNLCSLLYFLTQYPHGDSPSHLVLRARHRSHVVRYRMMALLLCCCCDCGLFGRCICLFCCVDESFPMAHGDA